MANAIVVGDIMACRAWCTLQEQAAVNTYHYECITVSGGAITDQDLSNGFDALAEPFYKGLMSTTGVYNGIQTYFAYRAPPAVYPHFVKTITNAGNGSTAGGSVPPTAAAIMSYGTPLRGPAERGRIYLPFLSVTQMDGVGHLTTGADVFINSQCTLLLPSLTITGGGSSATFVWVIAHKKKAPTPWTTTQITNAESSGKFGQMHKRGSYGRPNTSPI
jgi:hypothetical protein